MTIDASTPALAPVELVEEFTELLGRRLEAVYRYGLRQRTADREGGRLLAVVDEVDLKLLRLAGPASVRARKAGMRVRVDTANDILRAADTHPVFTLTLMDTRELLFGSDVLDVLHVDAADLRLRVEQSLRGLLHELTDEFLFAPKNELRLERLLRRCAHRLVYLLAGLLMVKGHLEEPKQVGGLGGAEAILRGADALVNGDDREALKALQRYGQREVNVAGDGLYELFGATLNLLKTLVRHADTHEMNTV